MHLHFLAAAPPPQKPHPTPTLLAWPAVNQTADKAYYFFDGYAHFAAGLACGLAGLGAGMAIGIVGDAGVRANAQQPKLFVGMILILIFAEALALYGLIGEFFDLGGRAGGRVGVGGGGGKRRRRRDATCQLARLEGAFQLVPVCTSKLL